MKKYRLLLICPHPDDEAFFFGGTLSKYADMGIEIHILVLSDGEAGRRTIVTKSGSHILSHGDSSDDLGRIRQLEFQESIKIIGVQKSNIYYSSIPNLEIDVLHSEIIKSTIKKVDPHIVLSFNDAGTTRFTNQDHLCSALATYKAFKSLLMEGLLKSTKRLYNYTLPNIQDYFDEYNEINNREFMVCIDVNRYIQRKEYAAKQHKTQAHLYEYFKKVGLLNVTHECFLERINTTGKYDRNSGDIFEGIDNVFSTNVKDYISFPMPTNKDLFTVSNDQFFSFYKEKVKLL